MSGRPFVLPIRTLQQVSAHARCRRCLSTQTPPVRDAFPSTPLPSPPVPQDGRAIGNAVDAEKYDARLPASQRAYRLSKTDFHLKKALAHPIPMQYLQHSSSPLLPQKEMAQRTKTPGHRPIVGVVVSAGKMDKTVRVRVPGRTWNKKIGKYFTSHTQHLVHDPNNSLVAGDVVSLHRLRVSSAVHHVVASIVAPFGKSVDERPPIPSPDERLAKYKEKRFAKLRRRTLRRQAADVDADTMREVVAR